MPDALEDVAAREAEEMANYREPSEHDLLIAALDDTIASLAGVDVPYLFLGGVASWTYGRPRVTHDIDVLVRPEDARAVLSALGERGFETEERAPHWLYKAYRDDVEIDVIFRSSGDIYLDDEMLEHGVDLTFHERPVRVVAPEDSVVLKALAHQEHSPRHWHDALAVLARADLDWDYLCRRARHGTRRVLSLLLYAQSNDLPVPDEAVRRLLATLETLQPEAVP
jgi:predicted nucleotidyltransferase